MDIFRTRNGSFELTMVKALNSPQLLLLSRIRAAKELEEHAIPLTHQGPRIDENLQNCCFQSPSQHTDNRLSYRANAEEARARYEKHISGHMTANVFRGDNVASITTGVWHPMKTNHSIKQLETI